MSDVLLVDDDQALLGVLARQLLQEGIMVRTAGTAQEALAQLRRRAPALLVLDLGLPGGEGCNVVEAMRSDQALNAVPLLVFTGRDLDSEQRAKLGLGPTRFLTKSKCSDADFRSLVLELLGRKGDNRRSV
jgi:two-component system KDP operon response regulator KdpE